MEITKYIQPIDRLIEFCKGLHEMERKPFAMNYSVRGRLISIYLPIEPMCELINNLAAQGLADFDLGRYYEELGYSRGDFYFRRYGFDFRIARHKEKLDNNHDIGWLQDTMGKELRNIKQELAAAVNLMEYHKVQAEELRQQVIKPKKRKR